MTIPMQRANAWSRLVIGAAIEVPGETKNLKSRRQTPQNRVLVLQNATGKGRFAAGAGGLFPNQANAPLGDPITFFTALQIISREKGFWRKSNIRNFSALDATELAS